MNDDRKYVIVYHGVEDSPNFDDTLHYDCTCLCYGWFDSIEKAESVCKTLNEITENATPKDESFYYVDCLVKETEETTKNHIDEYKRFKNIEL